MDSNKNEFSAEDSLKVIRSMIESTKSSIGDHSHYYLLWGYAIMMGCIIQYILLEVVHSSHHYYAWLVTPVAFIVHFIFLARDKKNLKRVPTFVGEANAYIGYIFIASSFVLPFVFSKIGWEYCYPFYILLISIATYISGSLMKFKPLRFGGLMCMVLVCIAPYLHWYTQILVMGFAVFISYIIPGHLLRSQYKRANTISYG